MPEYPASVERIVYSGGASGDAGEIVATFPPGSEVDFGWYGDFTGRGIIGFKLVIDADGVGDLFWAWDMSNPGTWTADPAASHIALHNSYDTPTSYVHVDGPTHYEHEFFWPGDPTFGGFDFNDPVSDLVISLAANHASYNEVFGTLRAVFGNPGDLTVTRFDLVLFTTPLSPCYKTLGATFEPTAPSTLNASANAANSVVWRDADNGTHVALTSPGECYGSLDTYGGPTILDVTIGMTASSAAGDAPFLAFKAGSAPWAVGDFIIETPITVTGGGAFADYTHTYTAADLTDAGLEFADLVRALTSETVLLGIAGASDVTVSELWLRVGHKCRTVYPLRRHPRTDGHGLGPRRHYPPPPQNRRAGNH